jgi:hypothetical protein
LFSDLKSGQNTPFLGTKTILFKEKDFLNRYLYYFVSDTNSAERSKKHLSTTLAQPLRFTAENHTLRSRCSAIYDTPPSRHSAVEDTPQNFLKMH